MRLSGKVALVAPGTFGVGYEAALLFAREGARVVVADEDEAGGRRTVDAIGRAGGEARFVRLNLLHEEDHLRAVQAAMEHFGALDAAFVCPDYYINGLIANQNQADMDFSLWYNCRSLFYFTKHALPAMLPRGGGSIIFLGSMYMNVSGSASCVYEVSKGSISGITKAFAERYAPQNVRFNCIAAGHVIDSPILGREDAKGYLEKHTYLVRDEGEAERLQKYYPSNRIGVPADVANLALFLASDESRYMNGAIVSVDGAFTTH